VRTTILLILVVVSLAAGCSGTPSTTRTADPAGVAGDDGAAMIALWPAHWNKLPEVLAVMGQVAPELAPGLAIARSELASAWSVIRLLAGRTLIAKLPETVPGLDSSAPIVISAFTPLQTIEAQAASLTAALATQKPPLAAGMRHRVRIPASDAAQLAGALEQALATVDPDDESPLRLVAPGIYGDDERLVRIAPGGGAVEVTIVVGFALSTLDEAGRRRVLGEPGTGPIAMHPLLADPTPSIARIHLRLDRFSAVGPGMAMAYMTSALVRFGDDSPGPMLMQGYSEILTAMLVTDPSTALVTDVIADLPASPSSAPALYVIATDRGREVLGKDAALASGVATPIRKIDLIDTAEHAPLPAIFDQVKSLRDASTLLHECGWTCPIYLGLGNGIGLVRIAEAEAAGATQRGLEELMTETPALGRVRVTLVGSVLVVEPMGTSTGATERVRGVKPRVPTVVSEAARCHTLATLALRSQLRLAADEGAQATAILDRFLTDQAANLACAAKDPGLADRVAKLRETIASLRALARATPPP
jgi:hypothetical protein